MSTKKGLPFPFLILAIILGVAIYKQFDRNTFTFEKPALVVVYFIAFAICLYPLIKRAAGK